MRPAMPPGQQPMASTSWSAAGVRSAGSLRTVCTWQRCKTRLKHPRLSAVPSADTNLEDAQLEEPVGEPMRLVDRNNVSPDFDDPNWADKVTDWYEFWHAADGELDEADGLDDEHDARAAGDTQSAVQRAERLISQLHSLRKRPSVVRILGPARQGDVFDVSQYTPPGVIREWNPVLSDADLRARVEKRRQRGAMDAEWRRRQALVARAPSRDNVTDVRLADWPKDEWTEEEVMDLITGGGKYAHPDALQWVEDNPLIPCDYSNDHGVQAIPDTEDFLASIGHLMLETDPEAMEGEVLLDVSDFQNPSEVFVDSDGTTYTSEPPNDWADLEMLRLQQEEEEGEAVKRPARRGGRRAAASEGEDEDEDADWAGEGEEEEEEEEEAPKPVEATSRTRRATKVPKAPRGRKKGSAAKADGAGGGAAQ